jgi:uncharacterized protein YgbK (DUF1537 family)
VKTIRILADDLTGALDSAGCFAGTGKAMPVVFDIAHLPKAGSCAVSTGSRDIAESEAADRMERFLPVFDGNDIAFKKIDSLLRGHVAAEIAHILRRIDFHAAVIAPAFPALDRVTRQGRQWATLAGDDRPQLVGPDLKSDFARFGIDLRSGIPGDAPAGTVFIADAQTEDDLRAIVESCRQTARILWCGSAGLADSLADAEHEALPLAALRMLIVNGTRHPVASLQLGRLSASDPAGVVSLRRGYDAAIVARSVNDRLRAGLWAALTVDFPPLRLQDARATFADVARGILPRLDRPDAMFVMGGDTLSLCCEGLGSHRLNVRGLLAPGIPVSEFHDGDWAGLTVISKSGAFGAADTLSDIVANAGRGHSASMAGSLHNRPSQKVPSH